MNKSQVTMGQKVSFFARNQKHIGEVVKLNPKKAKVSVDGLTWTVPYSMLAEPGMSVAAFLKPTVPTVAMGDRVRSTKAAKGETLVGEVIKLNPKTAQVLLDDGRIWRIHYELLEKISDIPPRVPPIGNSIKLPDDPVYRINNVQAFNVAVGDKVVFGRPNGQKRMGVVSKVNAKTYGIDAEDGQNWRVSKNLVRKA